MVLLIARRVFAPLRDILALDLIDPDYALRVRGFRKNRQIALRGRFPSLIGRRRGIDLRGIRCGNSGVTSVRGVSVAVETVGDRPFLSAARFY